MTRAVTTISVVVREPPSTAVPTWFNQLQHKQWTAVAGNLGEEMIDRYLESLADWGSITHNGVTYTTGNPDGNINTHLISESGMAVDSQRGELLVVASGGHNDYYGNEGYALNLKTENPSWVLCNRRTPVIGSITRYAGTVTSVSTGLSPDGVNCTIIESTTGPIPAAGSFPKVWGSCSARICFTKGAATGLTASGLPARVDYYEVYSNGGVQTARFYLKRHSSKQPLLQTVVTGDTFIIMDSFIDEDYGTGNPRIPAFYEDGRSRAMHTVNDPIFVNGRVWFAKQNSFSSGAGNGALGIVSWDRDYCLAQGEPAAWDRNNTLPWRVHRTSHPDGGVPVPDGANMDTYKFQPSCLDPSTGLIWQMSSARNFWSVDTNNNAGTCAFYSLGPTEGGEFFERASLGITSTGMWSVMIPNADPFVPGASVMVIGVKGGNGVFLFRPGKVNNPTPDALGSVRVGPITVPGVETLDWRLGPGVGMSDEWGAVYHQHYSYPNSHGAIVLWAQDTFNTNQYINLSPAGSLRKIVPPLDANGKLIVGGDWSCTQVPPNGGTPPPSNPPPAPNQNYSHANTFSKFNMLKDFGGPGVDALVVAFHDRMPVYVCKLDGAV